MFVCMYACMFALQRGGVPPSATIPMTTTHATLVCSGTARDTPVVLLIYTGTRYQYLVICKGKTAYHSKALPFRHLLVGVRWSITDGWWMMACCLSELPIFSRQSLTGPLLTTFASPSCQRLPPYFPRFLAWAWLLSAGLSCSFWIQAASRKADATLHKLSEVRRRGRKREMFG